MGTERNVAVEYCSLLMSNVNSLESQDETEYMRGCSGSNTRQRAEQQDAIESSETRQDAEVSASAIDKSASAEIWIGERAENS